MVDYNEILEEPIFLVNDYLEKGQKELEQVIEELKRKPKNYDRNARFLKNFTNNLFIAHKQIQSHKNKSKLNEHEQLKAHLKQQLEMKKQELIKKMQELQEQKPILREELQKDLILSKITDRALASRKISDHTYQLLEPFLRDEERIIIKELKKQEFNEEKIKKQLQEKLKDKFNEETYDRLRYHIVRDKLSLGQVSPLLEEETLEEVICDGTNQNLKISLKGKPNMETNISYLSLEDLNEQIKILAKKANQEITEEKPFLDAQIGKYHVQANLGTEYSQPRFIIHK